MQKKTAKLVFNSLIGGNKAFTIEAVFNPNNVGYNGADYNMIASKGDSSAAFRVSEQTVYFFIKNTNGSWKTVQVPLTSEEMNQWLHVAAVYDGNNISVYVEGKEMVTTQNVGNVATTTYPLGIGYCPETRRLSSGYLKNIRVYSAALSKDDLDNGTYKADNEKTVLWYDFDEYKYNNIDMSATGVHVSTDALELKEAESAQVSAAIAPYYAKGEIVFTSEDETVATVDENGVVTALKGGSCIIEVTTEVNKLTAACTIVVKEYVSSITLSETDKFMNVGSTGTLVASVGTDTATNKNIVWSSSNYDICYVDGNGNLSANSVGNAVITATAADGSGVSASCIVKVVDPVIGITVEPDTVRLLVGDSAKVTAVITPDSATVKDVSWTSSNEAIATVDESGEIFALSTGKCKITATSQDGNEVKGVCWVYVTPVVNISSLRINSKEIYMLSGRARQLSVIVRPVNNTDSYEWYSTDTGIVQVDQNGVITTVGPGTADVFVISNNSSVEASCTVHSLAMSTSRVRLEQYDRFNLDVIGTEDAVTWRSSNPRVCTVSSSGEVIGRRAGTATVTATVHNKTLSCTVTVTNIR